MSEQTARYRITLFAGLGAAMTLCLAAAMLREGLVLGSRIAETKAYGASIFARANGDAERLVSAARVAGRVESSQELLGVLEFDRRVFLGASFAFAFSAYLFVVIIWHNRRSTEQTKP